MLYIKIFIFFIVFLLVVFSVIQNMEVLSYDIFLRFNLFFTQTKVVSCPIYLVFMISFFIGLLLSCFLGIMENFRLRRDVKWQGKEIILLKSKIKTLDNSFFKERSSKY